MNKFNKGDNVYNIRHGLGTVLEIQSGPTYSVFVRGKSGTYTFYTPDGLSEPEDINPTLLTLEEARDKGYDVPRQVVKKTITRWARVFPDGDLFFYMTQAQAQEAHHNSTKESITVVKLTGEYEVEE